MCRQLSATAAAAESFGNLHQPSKHKQKHDSGSLTTEGPVQHVKTASILGDLLWYDEGIDPNLLICYCLLCLFLL